MTRSFTRAVAKLTPGFELPNALVDGDLDLALEVYDGNLLVLVACGGRFKKRLLLGAKLKGSEPRVSKLEERPGVYEVRSDVNLTGIARKTFK